MLGILVCCNREINHNHMHTLQSLVALFYEKTAGWQGEIVRRWNECVGDLALHMSCARIDGKTLFVHVHNARWMHELYMLSPEILESIRRVVPAAQITDIRYAYKPRVQRIEHTMPVQQGFSEHRAVFLSPRERESLNQIADEELRTVLLAYRARIAR
jgi:hypothetical protein